MTTFPSLTQSVTHHFFSCRQHICLKKLFLGLSSHVCPQSCNLEHYAMSCIYIVYGMFNTFLSQNKRARRTCDQIVEL